MASPKDKLHAGFQFGKSKHYKPRSKSLGAAALLQSGIEALRHRQKQRKADSDTEVDSGGPLLPRNRPASFKKAISKTNAHAHQLHGFPSHHIPAQRDYNTTDRELRTTVDWSENAVSGDHIWAETNASGDFCYVGEQDCLKAGSRRKCAACKIVVHTACMPQLERINFRCKPTFRDAGIRNYRENQVIRHHWVHRRRQEGKCKQCSKSFQQKLFQQKDIVAISCSWCKVAYHNKVACFMMLQIEEPCTLGIHAAVIIPPTWIIRLPKQRIQSSFKSSQRKKKKPSVKRKSISKKVDESKYKPFIIKPIPSPLMKPLLVFINPKSGGNQVRLRSYPDGTVSSEPARIFMKQ